MPPYKRRIENRVGRQVSLTKSEWDCIDEEAESRNMTRSMFVWACVKACISGKVNIDEIMNGEQKLE